MHPGGPPTPDKPGITIVGYHGARHAPAVARR